MSTQFTPQVYSSGVTVASAGDIADATAIPMASYAGLIIRIPAGSSINSLTFYHADSSDGTYFALYDSAAAAVTLTVAASRDYVIPAAVNTCSFVKILGNAAGTINWIGKTL